MGTIWAHICIKLHDVKLGIISEHAVAMGTVKHAFQLGTQLVAQLRSLSWLSHCKREKVIMACRKVPRIKQYKLGSSVRTPKLVTA